MGRRSCSMALVMVLASGGAAAGAQAAELAGRLDAELRRLEPRVVEWRRDIHRNPELSNREFRTSKLVAEHLRTLGLEVETGVAHTGVVALLRGGHPGATLALRADMDALPVTEQVDLPFRSHVTTEYRGEQVGVMHACGHDAHTAILMGVAEALSKLRAELPGSVLFVFQPAEEGAPAGEEGSAGRSWHRCSASWRTAPANHSPLFFVDEQALALGARALAALRAEPGAHSHGRCGSTAAAVRPRDLGSGPHVEFRVRAPISQQWQPERRRHEITPCGQLDVGRSLCAGRRG